MSEQVTHVGKLKPLLSNISDMESKCQEILDNLGHKRLDYFETAKEQVLDELYETHYISGDTIYGVYDESLGYQNVYHATTDSDGVISYVVSYYNGSCGFQEALDEAIENE